MSVKRYKASDGLVFAKGGASVLIELRGGWITEMTWAFKDLPWSGSCGPARGRAKYLKDLACCLNAAARYQETGR